VLNATVGADVTEDDVRDARRLDEVVAIDSLALLEFVVGLEAEFGRKFDASRLGREFFLDLNQLSAYLNRVANQRSS
jgi:acyl carrier protein